IVNPGYVNTIVTFEYGETTSYGYLTPEEYPTGGSSVNISADAAGLLPGKVYHFRAKAENTKGVAYSRDETFTTLGKVPEAVTSGAENIFLYSATLMGSVNANHLATEAGFEWGTTTEYGNTVTAAESPVSGDTVVNVKAELSGLQEETTYHYRLRAENSLGIAYGADKIFTTAGKSPVSVTRAATNVQKNTATLNGSVNANSFSTTITFEWGTTTAYGNTIIAPQSPYAGNIYTNVSAELTGLEMGTEYHFRIIAENEFGTRTSDDLTFTTLIPVTDIDGNVYDVKNYGTQVWMLENLKTTKYSNGDLIGTTIPANLFISWESGPKFQWAYDGDESYVAIYGRLYTWFAATDNRNICPTGWHVPTDPEWKVLSDYLIDHGYGYEGSGDDIAKSLASTTGWGFSDTPGNLGNDQASNNRSGFSALPGGIRQPDFFELAGLEGLWWTSTTSGYWEEIAWQRRLYPSVSGFDNGGLGTKSVGVSVRCLKD
ncbi:MAG: FISUMP domain-containing protein, partial [Methanococcaceae archaeon]